MNERVNPFAILKDPPAFSTKLKPERPVETDALSQIAEENNFTSRQVPKPVKKAERRKPRIHRTGRNVQFNAKATPETIAKFYRLGDERKVHARRVVRDGRRCAGEGRGTQIKSVSINPECETEFRDEEFFPAAI